MYTLYKTHYYIEYIPFIDNISSKLFFSFSFINVLNVFYYFYILELDYVYKIWNIQTSLPEKKHKNRVDRDIIDGVVYYW